MNIESNLSLYYRKARISFDKCISDQDNQFLKDELSISVNDIRVAEKQIKIIFTESIFDEYVIEASLELFYGIKEIGKYTYVLNNKEAAIDDILVFY